METDLELIQQRRILNKMKNIMENSEHPLSKSVLNQRLLQIRCNTDHYRRFFLPLSILELNCIGPGRLQKSMHVHC